MSTTNENLDKLSKPGQMRRWILKAGSTSLNSLVLEHVTIPLPKKGQVRVKVKAASINYRDQLF